MGNYIFNKYGTIISSFLVFARAWIYLLQSCLMKIIEIENNQTRWLDNFIFSLNYSNVSNNAKQIVFEVECTFAFKKKSMNK